MTEASAKKCAREVRCRTPPHPQSDPRQCPAPRPSRNINWGYKQQHTRSLRAILRYSVHTRACPRRAMALWCAWKSLDTAHSHLDLTSRARSWRSLSRRQQWAWIHQDATLASWSHFFVDCAEARLDDGRRCALGGIIDRLPGFRRTTQGIPGEPQVRKARPQTHCSHPFSACFLPHPSTRDNTARRISP
jgi:hypothetical protein